MTFISIALIRQAQRSTTTYQSLIDRKLLYTANRCRTNPSQSLSAWTQIGGGGGDLVEVEISGDGGVSEGGDNGGSGDSGGIFLI